MAQINVRFDEGPDHRTHHASGVWGGITPQGEIVATFFFEQQAYPQGLVMQLDDQGRPTETERLGGGELVRELLTTVVMSPTVAHSVGQWLLDKAQATSAGSPPEA
jgi:hypothetical protein